MTNLKLLLSTIFILFISNIILAQETPIPDDNFEQALIDLGIDTNGKNNTILNSDAAKVTSLKISSKEISNLSGIEAFTSLIKIYCDGNKLTSLDLSANTVLTQVYCYNNELTSLDISGSRALTWLYCAFNKLTSLNLSANTALTVLSCGNNELKSLNLSTNTDLTTLYCYNNELTSLNLSTNMALTVLSCGNNKLTNLEISTNTALTDLDCGNNELTSLDVSANTALTDLNCVDNELTSLDVSANTALITLFCRDNKLTSLNLSVNTALEELYCNNNELMSLNVKNGNNRSLTYFGATGNSDLTCIQVDDAVWSTDNWREKDAIAVYNEEDCVARDTESPVITLNGANTQEIELGTVYIELGATVTDNDPNYSEAVTIESSSVDTSNQNCNSN